MRFLSLLKANLGRHKRRTFLTMASVALALFLFASLRTVVTTIGAAAQLGSVRRLVTMLLRVLYRQMQWTVFEPNNGVLRDTIVTALENFLRQLYERNAFSGATEREAFFVRCDASINPQSVLDQGQLIVLVGVAPAEPLEFIVLQIARDGDGTLRVASA